MGCDAEHEADEGWEEVGVLNSWRGSSTGCLYHDKVLSGSCATLDRNGDTIEALEAFELNRWRGDKEFCM